MNNKYKKYISDKGILSKFSLDAVESWKKNHEFTKGITSSQRKVREVVNKYETINLEQLNSHFKNGGVNSILRNVTNNRVLTITKNPGTGIFYLDGLEYITIDDLISMNNISLTQYKINTTNFIG